MLADSSARLATLGYRGRSFRLEVAAEIDETSDLVRARQSIVHIPTARSTQAEVPGDTLVAGWADGVDVDGPEGVEAIHRSSWRPPATRRSDAAGAAAAAAVTDDDRFHVVHHDEAGLPDREGAVCDVAL